MARALDGIEEEEIVDALLELRGAVEGSGVDSSAADRTRARLVNLVNNFFHDKLTVMPEIRDYMELKGGA